MWLTRRAQAFHTWVLISILTLDKKRSGVGLGRQALATMILNSSCLTMPGKWLKGLGTVLMAQLAEDNRNLVSLINFTLKNFYLTSLVVKNSLIMSTMAFLSW